MGFNNYFSEILTEKISIDTAREKMNLDMFKMKQFSILPLLENKAKLSALKPLDIEKFLYAAKDVFDYIIINIPAQFPHHHP